MIGTRIAHYEIIEKLGEGGMGVVYKARDTRLDRTVAVKTLPRELASNPDRLARFEREAKFLAALNHPNIGAIYGLEEWEGSKILVLEFVPGESLSERLRRGALPVEEALETCRQTASALEAAHEAGVIHRDLKPANVMITPGGEVKVLDFGLAKVDPISFPRGSDPDDSSTFTLTPTAPGVIMGTAGYLSPEQARGKAVDRRTDIWALGVVLFECLSGTRAFGGDSISEMLVGILERDPEWKALPSRTPARIRELLLKCLQKDPRQRLRDAGDARLDIEKAQLEKSLASGALSPPPERAPDAKRKRWIPWLMAAGSLLLVGWVLIARGARTASPATPVHLEMKLAADNPIQMLVSADSFIHISRDGGRVAYVGIDGETTRIFVRAMEGGPAAPVSGTEGGINPYLSPDGRWLAYLSPQGSRLMKIPVEGGHGVALAETAVPVECSPEGPWGSDGAIYLTASKAFMDRPEGTLFRFSADGRNPEPLLAPDQRKGERSVNFCQNLPNGALLVLVTDGEGEHVAAWKPGTREVRRLVDGSIRAMYAPGGYLIYKIGFSLMAVPLDLGTLSLKGKPVEVIDRIMNPHVADNGTLVYLSVDTIWPQTNLVRVDREGSYKPLTGNLGILWYPRISPDGRRIAVQRTDPKTGLHVWVYDTERNVLARLATAPGPPHTTFERQAVWSPSGDRAAYAFTAAMGGPSSTSVRLLTVADGAVRNLETGAAFVMPESWSPDGRWITGTYCTDPHMESAKEIWAVPLDDPKAMHPLLAGTSIHRGSRISPDGRWVAYFSDESGQFEVYVQSFPRTGQKWQVSIAGGMHPLWSADSRELFYLQGSQVMAVPVRMSPAFQPGTPATLFTAAIARSERESPWDVWPDGRHFVIVQEDRSQGPTQIGVILNWFEEIRKKTAPSKS